MHVVFIRYTYIQDRIEALEGKSPQGFLSS